MTVKEARSLKVGDIVAYTGPGPMKEGKVIDKNTVAFWTRWDTGSLGIAFFKWDWQLAMYKFPEQHE